MMCETCSDPEKHALETEVERLREELFATKEVRRFVRQQYEELRGHVLGSATLQDLALLREFVEREQR